MMMDPKSAAELIAKSVGASVDVAIAETPNEEKIVVRAKHETAVALRAIVEGAKAGDRRAINKLHVFEIIKDPDVAARLAIMNRAQRRAYLAGLRGKKASRGRRP